MLDYHTLKEINDRLDILIVQHNKIDSNIDIPKELKKWLHEQADLVPEAFKKTDSDEEWFLLEVEECPICKKKMMKKDVHELFPCFYVKNQKSQLKIKNINFISESYQNGYSICHECEEAGLATFECYCCKKTKSTDKKQKTFGCYNVDYLCTDCYGIVSAKRWNELCKELNENHQYDHE